MKKLFFALTVGLIAVSCSENATEETPANDANVENTEETSAKNPTIKELHEKTSEFEGKDVTIDVVCWGSMKLNGVENMQFGDAENDHITPGMMIKLDENNASLKDLEKNAKVTLTGKVALDDFGAATLTDVKTN